MNFLRIEAVMESKDRGTTVIGVTSIEFANNVLAGTPVRHSSNKNLHEIANGVPIKFGLASTLALALCLNMLIIITVETLLAWGVTSPVWMSVNIPGGDEFNKKFLNKFRGVIKHL